MFRKKEKKESQEKEFKPNGYCLLKKGDINYYSYDFSEIPVACQSLSESLSDIKIKYIKKGYLGRLESEEKWVSKENFHPYLEQHEINHKMVNLTDKIKKLEETIRKLQNKKRR